MKLTDDKIIVKKCSNKTAGGIFVADIGQKIGNSLCEVLHVGPGRYNPYTGKYVESEVKVGDRVLINNSVLAKINLRYNGEKPADDEYLVAAQDCRIILEDGETV